MAANNFNFISDVDSKLKSACPNVQLKEVPPINQKRIVAFINHFTINMVEYLNKFAQTCQQRLFLCDEKIRKLEDELSLLESKLSSIPETSGVELEFNDKSPKIQTSPSTPDHGDQTAEHVKEEEPVAVSGTETGPSDQTTPSTSNETIEASSSDVVNPELAKYFKMVQVGVPVQAVKQKMLQDGFNPDLLDKR